METGVFGSSKLLAMSVVEMEPEVGQEFVTTRLPRVMAYLVSTISWVMDTVSDQQMELKLELWFASLVSSVQVSCLSYHWCEFLIFFKWLSKVSLYIKNQNGNLIVSLSSRCEFS